MKPVTVLLVFLLAGVVAYSTTVPVHAATVSLWSSAPPTMVRHTSTPSSVSTICTGITQIVAITELRRSYNVCTYGDERLKIGYFSSGGPYRGAVQFPYSNEAHVLEGVCAGVICHYSPESDVLVTQQPVGQYASGVVVFKHVTDRIHRIQTEGTTSYVFDTRDPDYAVKNNAGQYLATPSFGVSENGRWLIAELRDSGLVLVDTNSFAERQIVTSGYRYGYGLDPVEQLAVSNDGKSVALVGVNAGFSIIDVTTGCGQALVGDLHYLSSTTRCPSTDAAIGTFFPNFKSAERPRFLADGQQLEVTVNSWAEGNRIVTFLKSGSTAVHSLKLLSLGDSFTSGEGETDTRHYHAGTDESFDTCHVSSRAYPFLIAQKLGIASSEVKSVACAGAKMKDIVGSSDAYWGQAHRLGTGGLKLSSTDKTAAQASALESFQPGRALQSSFLGRYTPEIITIGIGGNDAGLMGKLKVCAMPGTCEWAKAEGLRATAAEIRRLYETLVSLFSYISKNIPDTQVFVVGYPAIIDAEGTCDVVTGFLLDHNERVFLDKSLEYLNQIIRAAAQQAGFPFLDIEHSLDGNNLCSSPASTAMNGLRLGNDISIFSPLPMLKVIGAGTFHPTPTGHVLIAGAILAGHPGLRQNTLCRADLTMCPVAPPSITPPSYWGAKTVTNDRVSYVSDFVLPSEIDSRVLRVDIPGGTFEPGSSMELKIQSEPVSLGTFFVDGYGGLSGTATIPNNVENGFHTLHLLGINREGNMVDLYQFVTIGQVETFSDAPPVEGGGSNSAMPLRESVRSPVVVLAHREQTIQNEVRNVAAVLGAQTTTARGQGPVPAMAIEAHHTEKNSSTNSALLIVVGLGCLVLTTICAILLWRRWAKAGT